MHILYSNSGSSIPTEAWLESYKILSYDGQGATDASGDSVRRVTECRYTHVAKSHIRAVDARGTCSGRNVVVIEVG